MGGDIYFLHEMSNIVGSFVLVGSFVVAGSFVPVGYFMSNGSFVPGYFRSWLRKNIFGYSPMVNF